MLASYHFLRTPLVLFSTLTHDRPDGVTCSPPSVIWGISGGREGLQGASSDHKHDSFSELWTGYRAGIMPFPPTIKSFTATVTTSSTTRGMKKSSRIKYYFCTHTTHFPYKSCSFGSFVQVYLRGHSPATLDKHATTNQLALTIDHRDAILNGSHMSQHM